jgi:hypothetical protein
MQAIQHCRGLGFSQLRTLPFTESRRDALSNALIWPHAIDVIAGLSHYASQ